MVASMSLLLLFLVLHGAAASSFSDPNKDFVKSPCYPNDSCSTLQTPEDDNIWGSRMCECGQHCVQHSTCCIDSPFAKINLIRAPREGEICQKIKHFSADVLMTSKCPNRWHHEIIREKCEVFAKNLRDPLTATPLTSCITGVTYKNYFCAECNGDTDNALLWNFNISYNGIKNLSYEDLLNKLIYDNNEHSWGIIEKDAHRNQETFHKIVIQFTLPPSLFKIVKKCYKNIVSECSASNTDEKVKNMCYSYYAPVQFPVPGRKIFTKYRNIHCALCNKVNVSERDEDMLCRLDGSQKGRKMPLSFALLLDVNLEGGEKVGKINKCEMGQIFDPFFKKCRSMTCALPGYVLKNGACFKA